MEPVYHPKCGSKNIEALCTFPDTNKPIDPSLRKEKESNILYNWVCFGFSSISPGFGS